MSISPSFNARPSYFWSCLTMKEECPFFSTTDPTFYYFGIGMMTLYVVFVIMILADLNFFWSVDSMQQTIDCYVNWVGKKVRLVEKDQRRLMSTQERIEKQLKKSKHSTRVLTALRGALAQPDPRHFSEMTVLANQSISQQNSPTHRSNDQID